MLNTSFSPWPEFTKEEVEAVSSVLLSNRVNYWTGEEGRKFEMEFASWVQANHGIALANGTVALDLALQGLGIGSVNGGAATDQSCDHRQDTRYHRGTFGGLACRYGRHHGGRR